jgi:hypothetical protein
MQVCVCVCYSESLLEVWLYAEILRVQEMTIIECGAFNCKFCDSEGYCSRNLIYISNYRICQMYRREDAWSELVKKRLETMPDNIRIHQG